jgi:nucleoside-diphosphate-sugar epimerase
MRNRERVLVTGGSGFIGAHLVHELVAEGHEVHLLLRPGSQIWRLADIEGRFRRHDADLCNRDDVARAVQTSQPEVIYHLATTGSFSFQRDRSAILSANIMGTANLLDALEDHDYRALVHTGSSSEYGHKDHPMREEDCLDPRTDYAIGKAAATHLCQAGAYRGRPNVTVRIFSAFGPWEDPQRLASYVMKCCSRGEPPQVTGGTQPRDFIYVQDVIDLLRLAANEPKTHGHILHAGTGRRQTVRDMVETIVSVCGGPPAIYGAEPMRAGEPVMWQADIAVTSARTGWQPHYDLRAAVTSMWHWFLPRQRGAA